MLNTPRCTQLVSLNSFWGWNSLFLCVVMPKITINRISPMA